MKGSFIVCSKTVAIFLLLASSLVTGCEEERDKQVEGCTLSLQTVVLNFRIVDKATDKDLFFTSPATYSTNQLVISTSSNQQRLVDTNTSASGEKYFSFPVGSSSSTDTFNFKIGNNAAVPVSITITSDGKSFCPTYFVSKVEYNGITETDVKTKVLTLRF